MARKKLSYLDKFYKVEISIKLAGKEKDKIYFLRKHTDRQHLVKTLDKLKRRVENNEDFLSGDFER